MKKANKNKQKTGMSRKTDPNYFVGQNDRLRKTSMMDTYEESHQSLRVFDTSYVKQLQVKAIH